MDWMYECLGFEDENKEKERKLKELEEDKMANINIELFEVEDTVTGRGGGRKGKGIKYGKYIDAVTPYIDDLKEKIEKSKDNRIRVKTKEMAKTLGKSFEKLNETSLYWGLKYTLFHQDIVTDTGTHKDGSKLLIMRKRTSEDILPKSLRTEEEIEEGVEEEIEEGVEEEIEEGVEEEIEEGVIEKEKEREEREELEAIA